MGLEDIALFRSIPGAVVLYPSEGVSAFHATTLAANHRGIVFIRTGRPDAKTFYKADEEFQIGKSKVAVTNEGDKITVVGAGVTFEAALAAAETLKAQGINIRVIDTFCVKPIDKDTLVKEGKETNNTLLVVEDHYPEGGIYEAVCSAVSTEGIKVHNLTVNELPRSGTPAELLAKYKIDADAIVEKVKELTS